VTDHVNHLRTSIAAQEALATGDLTESPTVSGDGFCSVSARFVDVNIETDGGFQNFS